MNSSTKNTKSKSEKRTSKAKRQMSPRDALLVKYFLSSCLESATKGVADTTQTIALATHAGAGRNAVISQASQQKRYWENYISAVKDMISRADKNVDWLDEFEVAWKTIEANV